MRGLLTLLLLVALAGVLYLTNPTREDFGQFVQDEASEILVGQGSGGLLGGLGGMAAGRLAAQAVDRTDYFVFSTYTLEVSGQPDGAYEFLGVAGQFFETEAPGEEEPAGEPAPAPAP